MKLYILTTSYPRFSGDYSGIFIHNLSKDLISRKIKVDVLAPHDRDTKNCEIIDKVKIKRFKYWFTKKGHKLTYKGGIPYNLSNSYLAKIQLPFLMLFLFLKGLKNARKYDIIHAHFLLSGFIGVFIKKFSRKKLVITAHGSDVYKIPKKGIFKKIFIWIISKSNAITTVSYANKRRLIDLGLKKEMITVIPNGVNLSQFKTKSILGENRDKIDIVWIGKINEIKGLEYLIQAMVTVIDIHPNSNLTLIGDGPLKQKYEKLTFDLSLNKNIVFAGSIKNNKIPDYLEDKDIFVLPSLSEGLPLAIIEAMAASKPIITSNVGGISDLVDDGVNGILIDSKNPDLLAEKICYLIENPKIRKNMGIESRKKIEKNFTWDKIINNLIQIYENLK
jgi:glycosyltransferase involved in cell wall biosynthesis